MCPALLHVLNLTNAYKKKILVLCPFYRLQFRWLKVIIVESIILNMQKYPTIPPKNAIIWKILFYILNLCIIFKRFYLMTVTRQYRYLNIRIKGVRFYILLLFQTQYNCSSWQYYRFYCNVSPRVFGSTPMFHHRSKNVYR